MVLLGAEKQLEVGDECRGKFTQGNIAYFIAMFDELLQVVVNGAILSITALAFFLFAKLFMVELSDGKQNTAYRCKRISLLGFPLAFDDFATSWQTPANR